MRDIELGDKHDNTRQQVRRLTVQGAVPQSPGKVSRTGPGMAAGNSQESRSSGEFTAMTGKAELRSQSAVQVMVAKVRHCLVMALQG